MTQRTWNDHYATALQTHARVIRSGFHVKAGASSLASHKRPFLRSSLTELITPKADIGEHEILAEPFPGTLAQGLVLVFAKEFSGS